MNDLGVLPRLSLNVAPDLSKVSRGHLPMTLVDAVLSFTFLRLSVLRFMLFLPPRANL